jgi:hypothetical protein
VCVCVHVHVCVCGCACVRAANVRSRWVTVMECMCEECSRTSDEENKAERH